jgi:hypothetical protein
MGGVATRILPRIVWLSVLFYIGEGGGRFFWITFIMHISEVYILSSLSETETVSTGKLFFFEKKRVVVKFE